VAAGAAVFGNGNNTGVTLSTTTIGGEVYQDGGDATISIPVLVKYQGIDDAGTSGLATGDATVNSAPTPQTASNQQTPILWEQITLTQDHLFYDFDTDFRGFAAKTASPTRYAYGIDDQDQVVYFLVSRGTVHGGTNNSSIYLRLTWSGFSYHYVRAIEVEKLEFTSADIASKPKYLTQAEALTVGNRSAWTTKLIDGGIGLKVYYDDASSLSRSVDYFRRAVALGVAGVINDPGATLTGDPSDDGFGEIMIGYYTSAPLDSRDPIKKGDFPNLALEKLPIAVFIEGSGYLQKKASAKEGDKDLDFIVGPAGTTFTGRIDGPQLLAVQNTFDFYGQFQKGGEAAVEALIIPGSDFRTSFFPGTPLRVSGEVESVEVSFVVPNRNTLNSEFTAGSEKAIKYGVFVGEEDSINATVYPSGYDRWPQ
jgi:hypothetical protein